VRKCAACAQFPRRDAGLGTKDPFLRRAFSGRNIHDVEAKARRGDPGSQESGFVLRPPPVGSLLARRVLLASPVVSLMWARAASHSLAGGDVGCLATRQRGGGTMNEAAFHGGGR